MCVCAWHFFARLVCCCWRCFFSKSALPVCLYVRVCVWVCQCVSACPFAVCWWCCCCRCVGRRRPLVSQAATHSHTYTRLNKRTHTTTVWCCCVLKCRRACVSARFVCLAAFSCLSMPPLSLLQLCASLCISLREPVCVCVCVCTTPQKYIVSDFFIIALVEFLHWWRIVLSARHAFRSTIRGSKLDAGRSMLAKAKRATLVQLCVFVCAQHVSWDAANKSNNNVSRDNHNNDNNQKHNKQRATSSAYVVVAFAVAVAIAVDVIVIVVVFVAASLRKSSNSYNNKRRLELALDSVLVSVSGKMCARF